MIILRLAPSRLIVPRKAALDVLVPWLSIQIKGAPEIIAQELRVEYAKRSGA